MLPRPGVVVVIGLGDETFTIEDTTGRRSSRGLVAALTPGPGAGRARRVRRGTPDASGRAELDGSGAALEDVWGPDGRRLRERLAGAGSWAERLALTDAFRRERAARGPRMEPKAAAWERIVARRGRVRVGDLAASCGWSRKRLWSRFREQVGLTPKRAAMLVRFDRAARSLRAGQDAASVAQACGYAGQLHLHRDVLAFAGCTPDAAAPGAG